MNRILRLSILAVRHVVASFSTVTHSLMAIYQRLDLVSVQTSTSWNFGLQKK